MLIDNGIDVDSMYFVKVRRPQLLTKHGKSDQQDWKSKEHRRGEP
jgi:hypothetical protein